MGRKRSYTAIRRKGEGIPALRIIFPGAFQMDFLAVHKIAKEEFEMTGTELSRQIISDWVKKRREMRKRQKDKEKQLTMPLRTPKKRPAKGPEKKEGGAE